MFKATVCILIFFVLLATSLAFRISTEIKDGIPDGFKTYPFLKLDKGLYYIETKWRANWFEANERCHEMDAELISFETMEEWDMINRYLVNNKIEDRYWTSGNDLGKEGRHIWASNGQPIKLDKIWTRNNPDNDKNQEHCDELGYRWSEKEERGLNDNVCSESHLYICERPQAKINSVVVW